jgi:exopolyphosphatase/guanosine-5'-triphosphate,3'-diphosphate pyrophosphatase
MLLEASFLADDSGTMVVATGGNADFLADMCPSMGLGYRAIDVGQMQAKLGELTALSPKERAERHGMTADRADVVVPAIYVLTAIASKMGAAELRVPGVGLKDGVLIDLADHVRSSLEEGEDAAGLERQAIAVGRRYRFDEAHARHVAELASVIFDGTLGLHELGAREREWLRLAALLHDIGDFIGYEAHHKHSYYLIANTELAGIEPVAKEIIANVARYHRKAYPDLSHAPYQQLDRQARGAVKKLSAILRIADSLDREHRGLIEIRRIEHTSDTIEIEVKSEADVTLSLWTAKRKADLLQDLTGREVRIEQATLS